MLYAIRVSEVIQTCYPAQTSVSVDRKVGRNPLLLMDSAVMDRLKRRHRLRIRGQQIKVDYIYYKSCGAETIIQNRAIPNSFMSKITNSFKNSYYENFR